ncbi:hypothetical protein [Fontimonas thermophila]|uniref:hypothetical protein n=1 Tax=Fontimonas thermophila TaxID=1076937 RepID=UPI00117AAB9B|nr:hypothetical protein [Fontimonas thermophila]
MAEILTAIAALGVLLLIFGRARTRGMHWRVAEWPLGKRVEGALALVFAVLALLGFLAGEYGFAGWLTLMAAIIAAFAMLTWPRQG